MWQMACRRDSVQVTFASVTAFKDLVGTATTLRTSKRNVCGVSSAAAFSD